MARALLALVGAGLLVLAGPALPWPAGTIVEAHAQLVSSTPGGGEVVAEPPSELRLVFSEPIDARFTSLDLLDGEGRTIALALGAPDPTDPYALVSPVPNLEDGSYTVNWRALSAADGHTTSGFFTFGVGDVTLGGGHTGHGAAGDLHGGHGAGHAMTEVQARLFGYLGFMLAFGLTLFAALVLRPVTGRWSRRLAGAQAIALGAGTIGAILLGVVAGSTPGLDPLAYLGGTRTGGLLVGRAVAGVAGALVVAALLRLGRTGPAIAAGGLASGVGLALLALGGHAAAYASAAPVGAILVHLAAASVWFGGVVALVDIAVLGRRRWRPALGRLVPRFSAMALVSVGLAGLTGLYLAWVQTRDLTSIGNPYSAALALKVALFGGALVLGGLNYLDGGRRPGWLGGFHRRVGLEAALAIGVLVATGNLASGSPPAQERPVPIAPAVSSAGRTLDATLEIQPGRPGPNRFWVQLADPTAGGSVELVLQRLDGTGDTRLRLRSAAEPGRYVADGGLLPADSRWDGSVVLSDASGAETGRARFEFALDDESISEGRATPPLDPALLAALLLLVGALLGATYVLAGGGIPRVERRTGRLAALAGSAVGAVLGVLLLTAGPRL